MAFSRLGIRRIPGLIQNLQNPSSVASAREAIPAVLCCTNKVPIIGRRQVSSEDLIKAERAKQIGWWQVVWEWYNKVVNPPEKVVTEEEKLDKEEFFNRIQDLYYKKPPEVPGIEHFKEGFDVLIKWDDWQGVEALWNLAEADQIVFDDETIDRVEDYLLEVRRRKWYE